MEVKIEKLDNLGRGITYIKDKICFINNALPGEIIKINITKEKQKYLEAEPIEYIKKSKKRIKEECPYSNICGGCQLNHISYSDENNYKEEKVKEILLKYANITPSTINTIKYHERNNYRNKIVLHGKNHQLGLYQKNSNEIIPIKKCLLASNKINEIISILNNNKQEITEAIIKVSNDDTKAMVSINGKIDNVDKIKEKCDVLIVNNTYYTKNKQLLTKIGTKKYHEGINSFFQINHTLTKDLYDEVIKHIDNSISNVLDLYCGTGTIGIYIANNKMNITGIDYNKSNIEDAINNKELNKIKNINFICSKVEDKIESFKNIDLIIVDPPRKGLDTKTIKYLKKIKPKKIIYVSCEIITLARDLKELKTEYQIKEIQPFNMFPRTLHCEALAVLERK